MGLQQFYDVCLKDKKDASEEACVKLYPPCVIAQNWIWRNWFKKLRTIQVFNSVLATFTLITVLWQNLGQVTVIITLSLYHRFMLMTHLAVASLSLSHTHSLLPGWRGSIYGTSLYCPPIHKEKVLQPRHCHGCVTSNRAKDRQRDR